MRFSIVTISLNQAPFLEEAICSVLNQDYADLEYIVVDPGSVDGSREIIERYRHRISRVIFKSDSGAPEGLNNGFASASGDVFGFLNSDDVLLPGAISRTARQFSDDPKNDIVMGHMRVIDRHGNHLRNSYSDRYDARAFSHGASTICQPSTFFKADLFRRSGGFNPGNTRFWDAELFAQMQRMAKRQDLVNDFLSAFRIHGASVTGKPKDRRARRKVFVACFESLTGRQWRRRDNILRFYYLLRKYVREPRSFFERILRGSILGRARRM